MDVMNKEERNGYIIHMPSWLARFISNTLFTPQHLLEKPNKRIDSCTTHRVASMLRPYPLTP